MQCDVIPRAMDKSVVDLQVQLSTTSHFMCAVEFLVQFNGESKCVPVDSSSLNFTIDVETEEYLLEGMVYTLDNESTIGQNPCFFDIPGEYQFHCVYW